MKRGEVYWADLGPPAGRRPVLILTRSSAIPVLTAVVVAPVTTHVRGIGSELPLGAREGLTDTSAASFDNLLTIRKTSLDRKAVGHVGADRLAALDDALRFALGVAY